MPYTLPDASVIWDRQSRMEQAAQAAAALRAALINCQNGGDPCPFEGYDIEDVLNVIEPPAPGYIERAVAASFGLVEVAA